MYIHEYWQTKYSRSHINSDFFSIPILEGCKVKKTFSSGMGRKVLVRGVQNWSWKLILGKIDQVMALGRRET